MFLLKKLYTLCVLVKHNLMVPSNKEKKRNIYYFYKHFYNFYKL